MTGLQKALLVVLDTGARVLCPECREDVTMVEADDDCPPIHTDVPRR